MLLETSDHLIYPRLTLLMAMCLSFVIRVRRIAIHHAGPPDL